MFLSRLLENMPGYERYRQWRVRGRGPADLARWEAEGRPVPPPHLVKQHVLRGYARDCGIRTLVETGTYYGDMVAALVDDFDRVISIELQPELADRARRRFSRDPRVQIVCGDSGDELAAIVQQLDGAALFWLDGHYSGGQTARGTEDTPVLRELGHVLRAERSHVVLVDDARLFGTDPAYPTVEQMTCYIRELSPGVSVTIADDIFRIVPVDYSDRIRAQA